jgi:hypothetical protein
MNRAEDQMRCEDIMCVEPCVTRRMKVEVSCACTPADGAAGEARRPARGQLSRRSRVRLFL